MNVTIINFPTQPRMAADQEEANRQIWATRCSEHLNRIWPDAPGHVGDAWYSFTVQYGWQHLNDEGYVHWPSLWAAFCHGYLRHRADSRVEAEQYLYGGAA